jgi:hypothetical protein
MKWNLCSIKAQLIPDFQLNNHILLGSVIAIISLQPVNNLSEIKKVATKKKVSKYAKFK